jgi:hypothetical protein
VLELRRVGGNHRASTLSSQLYFLLRVVEFLGTREEKESRSDNQEQEDIDGTGEVEHRVTEERGRRRDVVVSEL